MLNPQLYGRLVECFGDVKVRHQGEPMQAAYGPDLTHPGRMRLKVHSPGEEYAVCCPFCGDMRYRLTINHRWGVWDSVCESRNLWLAHCYNEECLTDRDRRKSLYERVYRGKATDRLPMVERVEGPAQPVRSPGMTVLIDELKRLQPEHEAVRYLERRGFSVAYLARQFQIGVVLDSECAAYRGRIYVPIYVDGQLRGWQLRTTHDEHKLRWYSCPGMSKSRMLYNQDEAFKHRVIVLVEGATSAWAVGRRAVASFGKSVSAEQWRLLERAVTANRGILCLMLDPDDHAQDEKHALEVAYRQSQTYTGLKHRVVRVWLPPNEDPASVSAEFLRETLQRSIRPYAELLCDERISAIGQPEHSLRI